MRAAGPGYCGARFWPLHGQQPGFSLGHVPAGNKAGFSASAFAQTAVTADDKPSVPSQAVTSTACRCSSCQQVALCTRAERPGGSLGRRQEAGSWLGGLVFSGHLSFAGSAWRLSHRSASGSPHQKRGCRDACAVPQGRAVRAQGRFPARCRTSLPRPLAASWEVCTCGWPRALASFRAC